MVFIAFKGATRYEMAVGRVWLTFLRPRFWNRRSWRTIIRIGLEPKETRP